MGLTESTRSTLEHIREVQANLCKFAYRLQGRGIVHDRTKLEDPEHAQFEEAIPQLTGLVYGSEAYLDVARMFRPAIDHHNRHNSHHPEHYENGIRGFDLVDLVEMYCDWKAAVKRGANGDIRRIIEMNQARFGYSDDLKSILLNTVDREV